MMSVDNVIFSIINYVIYGVVLYWAGKRFIIPYLMQERADEHAQLSVWRARYEQSRAAHNHLMRRQAFFLALFGRLSHYVHHVTDIFLQNRQRSADQDRRRHDSLQEQYKKIYEEHQRACAYQQLTPEIVREAQDILMEYYRDPKKRAAYFDRLRMRINSNRE